MEPVPSTHYDDEYFRYQAAGGQFAGIANRFKFEPFVGPDDDVLDFGCGTGYLLANLTCRRKMGVEVNPRAVEAARANGIEVYTRTSEVPDASVDVIISNHALEHALHPLAELQALYPKLRPGGRIVFVVPCEGLHRRWRRGDINNHLYTWSPMNLGNLFAEAGYHVVESKPLWHLWPPKHRLVYRLTGWRVFHLICRVWSVVGWGVGQVRLVGNRPHDST